jgi:hypothetical protein
MPFITPRRLAPVACALALVLSHAARAADIGGSIRFSDENFSLAVQTVDRTLKLTSRGCNNFDLALLPGDRNAGLLLRDSEGRNLGTIGSERSIETRTCGAERYTTELTFSAPSVITWTPQADELIGGKKVKYSAQFAPAQLHFDPPIEVTVYEKNSHARPIRIANVAAAELPSTMPITYTANAVHFATPAGTIERKHGFSADDEFFLESESQHFARPDNGDGESISFEAPSAKMPTSLSLYYPPGGPHILAFTADERGREPTPVKSLRVDDEQLLTPQFAISRSEPLALKRGFLHFASGEQLTPGSVQVVLGSQGSDVTHVRVASSEPTALQVAKAASGPFAPSIDIAKVAGGAPLDIPVQIRTPGNASTGTYNFSLIVTSDGGLKRKIPITLNVTDPYARTRTAILALMVILLIGVVAWTLLKRRRVEVQAADQRAMFFQKHYGEYSEIRERIEAAMASDVSWLKAAQVFEEFTDKHLERALAPQEWSHIQQLATQQKGREALGALDRALVRLEG